MFNNYELNIIPILNRFNVKKVLLIGLSNETILNKLLTYYIKNDEMLYTIDNEINAEDLINNKNNYQENIKHFKGQSLNILPYLKNFDAILINNDPNWYTVYNELNLIKKNNLKFPLVFICNNKYPHKRRDSYINPNNIPDEYKHECYNKLPIKYEEDNKIKHAMIEDGFCHAIYEETPKNGVLTAIEDFLNENKNLKKIEIDFLEGITLIYNNSLITNNKIKKIISEENEFKYNNLEISDKIIENQLLLNQISEIESYVNKQNKQIETIKKQVNSKEKQLQKIKSELNIANSEKEKNTKLNKQKPDNSLKIKKTLDEKDTKINTLKQKSILQTSKIERKEYCITCFKEELSNKQLEINYLKNDSLTKKILNPFSYLYLLLKSQPKEVRINLKLYKSLKNSSCFDIGFYLNNDKNLIESKWYKYFSPELHYVCNGFNENRTFNKKYFNRKSKKELLNYLLTFEK